MYISSKVKDIFNLIDSGYDNGKVNNSKIGKQDGKLDANEIQFARKYINECSGIKLTAGMTIYDMAKANDIYREKCVLGEKDYSTGRYIKKFGKMIWTLFVGRDEAVDDKNSVEVMQGEYSVNTYSKKTSSMQTWNIQNCVAVTIYDKVKKQGFMAHIDCISKARDLGALLKRLNFDPKNCEARIIGGMSDMSDGNVEIIDNTLRNMHFNIVEQDVLGKEIRAIQMDLKTGEVYDYEEKYESNLKRDKMISKNEYIKNIGKNKYSQI